MSLQLGLQHFYYVLLIIMHIQWGLLLEARFA